MNLKPTGKKTCYGRCTSTWKITRTEWCPQEQNGRITEIEVVSYILKRMVSWKVTRIE
jgi:hypothetical protein